MLGQQRLTHQCQSMYKTKLYMLLLLVISANTYSADIMDIYNRSLKFNTDLKIITNEHKISEEIYNQTSSSIFPDISITANTQEVNVISCITIFKWLCCVQSFYRIIINFICICISTHSIIPIIFAFFQ